MTDKLCTLASFYRAAQLYAHMAHNVTYGPTFYQDHAAFGDLYNTYEDAYDALIERAMGLGGKPNFKDITQKACEMFCFGSDDSECKVMFTRLCATEGEIREFIDKALEGASEGTKNFLQGLADESEQRTYKLKQRLK